jgi:hypothetical protein
VTTAVMAASAQSGSSPRRRDGPSTVTSSGGVPPSVPLAPSMPFVPFPLARSSALPLAGEPVTPTLADAPSWA